MIGFLRKTESAGAKQTRRGVRRSFADDSGTAARKRQDTSGERAVIWKNGLDMITLAACLLHGTLPSAEELAGMDLPAVRRLAEAHMLGAIAGKTLERANEAYSADGNTTAEGSADGNAGRSRLHFTRFPWIRRRSCP